MPFGLFQKTKTHEEIKMEWADLINHAQDVLPLTNIQAWIDSINRKHVEAPTREQAGLEMYRIIASSFMQHAEEQLPASDYTILHSLIVKPNQEDTIHVFKRHAKLLSEINESLKHKFRKGLSL